MKNVFLQLSIIGILFIFVPTGMKANTAPDSIHTLKHVMKIHVAVPDSALKLLDVMENRKPMPDKCPTKFVIFTKKAATNECELRLEGPSGYCIA